MHEIAFQADKRFAAWSVCVDCSPLFLFYGSILFGITFTRKIYSTSSRFLAQMAFCSDGWSDSASCLLPLDYCSFRLLLDWVRYELSHSHLTEPLD